MTEPCPDAYIALAARLADAAGDVVRRFFRTRVDVETKADQSPVTIANQLLRRFGKDHDDVTCLVVKVSR